VRYALAFLIAWVFAVANVSAFSYIKVLGVTPDFVLIFACCWAVVRGEPESLYVVPFCGLMRDLLSSDPLGTAILGFAPIVIFAALSRQQIVDSEFPNTLVVVAASSIAFGFIQSFVLAIDGQHIEAWTVFTRVILPGAVVNSLFAAIIYLPVRWSSPRVTGLRGSRGLPSPYS
jgi:rod shape-determining protein MreD